MHVEPATLAHARALVGRLRESDRMELTAATGSEDHQFVIEQSILGSSQAWAAMVGDRVIGLGGVSPVGHLAYVGSPWFVASDEIRDHTHRFLLLSRRKTQSMLAEYDMLTNWVDARNAASIRWLKWLGYIVEAPQPFGARQLPFCRFWRRKNV